MIRHSVIRALGTSGGGPDAVLKYRYIDQLDVLS